MIERSMGCGNVTVVLPRSTRLNCRSIISLMASRQEIPSTIIGMAKATPVTVSRERNGRPAVFRRIINRRDLVAVRGKSASIQERRKPRGAAGRIATDGARRTTCRNAVKTPREAAVRLIAMPSAADQGVSPNGSSGRRKNPR